LIAAVAFMATGSLMSLAGSAAAQSTPTYTCTTATGLIIQSYTPCGSGNNPPDLLNQIALTQGIYAATPAQITSLDDFQQQAVADVVTDHDLAPTDTAAVESWGRDAAEADLWALIVQAIQTPAASQTPDQQNVAAWFTNLTDTQSLQTTTDAGLEYTKWAGLGIANYQALLASNPTQSQLLAFLSQEPQGYTDGGSFKKPYLSVDGGVCVYSPPAPYQGQYTSSITGSTPYEPCINGCTAEGFGCALPYPSYSDFVDWGGADEENQLVGTPGWTQASEDIANAAVFGAASVGAAGVSFGIGTGLAPVLGGTAFQLAVFPFAGREYADIADQETFDAAVQGSEAAGESAEEADLGADLSAEASGGAVAASGAAAVAGVAITAIVIAVEEGIIVTQDAQLPGQLASLIAGALTTTPDLATALANPQAAAGLFGLFVGATLPNPIPGSCYNDTSNTVGFTNPNNNPCLNPTPIPAPSPTDPSFAVQEQGSSTTTDTSSINVVDDQAGISTTASLSENWFVETTTAPGVPPTTIQDLFLRYTDWQGNEQEAWVLGNATIGYQFVVVAQDSPCDPFAGPGTCEQQQPANGQYPSAIDYIGPDGEDYSASLVSAPPTGIPPLPAYTGGASTGFGTNVFLSSTPSSPFVGSELTLNVSVTGGDPEGDPIPGTVNVVQDVDGTDVTLCANAPLTYTPPTYTQVGNTLYVVPSTNTAACSWTPTVAGLTSIYATYDPTNDSDYYASQSELTVNPALSVLPTSMTLSPGSTTTMAGNEQFYSATGYDAEGDSINLTGLETLSIEPVNGGSTTGATCAGSTCTATVPGTYDIVAQAEYAGVNLEAGAAMTVTPNLPVSITINSPGSTVLAGNYQAYTVTAADAYGNQTDVTSQADLTIAPDNGGSATGAICGGQSCVATADGTYQVDATVTLANSLFATASTVTVVPNTPVSIALSPASATTTAGTAEPYTVTATDNYGNTSDVTAESSLAIFPTAGGSATGATCSATACGATVAGTYQVLANASLPGAPPLVNVATLTVTPAAPAAITAESGERQTVTSGSRFAKSLVATVTDAFGNAVPGAAVTFTLPAPSETTGGATFAGGALTAVVDTTSAGIAKSPKITAHQPGRIAATASVAGSATPAAFELTVTPLANLAVSLSAPATAGPDSPVSVQITVTNHGPSAASQVNTTLAIPTGWTVVNADGGTIRGETLDLTDATLADQGTVNYTVTLETGVRPGATKLNAEAVSNIRDPNYHNNTASASVDVT
jgi:hypothetical protein